MRWTRLFSEMQNSSQTYLYISLEMNDTVSCISDEDTLGESLRWEIRLPITVTQTLSCPANLYLYIYTHKRAPCRPFRTSENPHPSSSTIITNTTNTTSENSHQLLTSHFSFSISFFLYEKWTFLDECFLFFFFFFNAKMLQVIRDESLTPIILKHDTQLSYCTSHRQYVRGHGQSLMYCYCSQG